MRVVVACIVACGLATIYCFVVLGYDSWDLAGHWRICKYSLMGIDPFPLIGKPAAIEAVGAIPKGFSTAPWSLVLGSALYGAMLPMEVARVYVVALHVVALAVLAYIVHSRRARWGLQRADATLALLLVVVHFSLMYSLRYGNTGGALCIFLIQAMLIADDHPWLAGILVAFAMTKPQIAVPICGVMLLNGKFRTIALAAAIDLVSWGCASVLTGTPALGLLSEMGQYGVMVNKQYLGLLSPLHFAGVAPSTILAANVGIGVVFTVALWLLVRSRPCRFKGLLTYVPACAASVVWIYKNGTDFLILCVCAFFFYYLFAHVERTPARSLVALLGMVLMETSRILVGVFTYTHARDLFMVDVIKSVEGFAVLAFVAYLVIRWTRVARVEQDVARMEQATCSAE
ncbi:MAG: hypothetical protein Q4A01_03165 [Coriobacteriales bacterium]|nr:hypothetical protein [Coriobacteriales bacterium]